MTDQAPERWEVGSEFHWYGWPPGPCIAWPEPASWYCLGRHAVAALLQMSASRPRLWVPEYFCHDVVRSWRANADILLYRDDPCRSEPQWESLQARAGDWVLAMNYFGLRDGRAWRAWGLRESICLLEDHSHDPVSPWARSSDADYAFASLRKTLPVPDGGMAWSPRGRPLPAPLRQTADAAIALKLSAMLLKSEYLAGRAPAAVKERYRDLQRRGEAALDAAPPTDISALSREILRAGVPRCWREQRYANAAELLASIKSWDGAVPLQTKWPEGAVPLAVVLRFDSSHSRDLCRQKLQANQIYCPVHWPMMPETGPAQSLSGRLLSIPIDQRYNIGDMRLVSHWIRS